MSNIMDFKIENGVLLKYIGKDSDVVIPDTVTEIGVGAFGNCDFLKSVIVGESVKTVGVWAFRECINLERVVLSEGVEKIFPWAFQKCIKLRALDIPQSADLLGDWVFDGCINLEQVRFLGDKLTIFKDGFHNCKQVTIVASEGSVAAQFAKENGLKLEIL